MDFEEIKKLLELGGGKCAVYREGEPGYIILNAAEFQKLFKNHKDASFSSQNDVSIDSSGKETGEVDFQIEDCFSPDLDAIKIEDLPL